MKVWNATRGVWLASHVEVADRFVRRLVGLLGRPSLPPEHGLLITWCDSIHTIGMRFPIDVVFVDQDTRVVKTVEALKPLRVVLPIQRAVAVLELPVGTIRRTRTCVGDQLHFLD
ncbi:MAG: DUF192 domain-containing protein [Blastocatellia bacterium]|nr:DUF192 domain-containing protein [Blastocatellia bacterium]